MDEKMTRSLRRTLQFGGGLALVALLINRSANSALAMHISEGILEVRWAGFWYLIALPFIYAGIKEIKAKSEAKPEYKSFLALTGAAVFVISCMPIPVPVAGSCSHPCGTGLAAILIGPAPTVVIATISLGLQALFMAHGGLTTLGANVFAMGIAGSFVGYGSFKIARRLGLPLIGSAFLAGLFSDWATYAATSFILSLSIDSGGSLVRIFLAILIAFVPTQLPLGILEGLLSAGAYRFLDERLPLLRSLASAQGGLTS